MENYTRTEPNLWAYIKGACRSYWNDCNKEPIVVPLPEIAMNGIDNRYRLKVIDDRFANVEDRFTSCRCACFEVKDKEGILKISFDIVFKLNVTEKKELARSLKNDVLKICNLFLEYKDCTIFLNVDDVAVELQKNKMFIYVALNQTGEKLIIEKQKYIEENFEYISKM